MKKKFERVMLLTGGAGFIGSHALRYFVRNYPNYHIINLDALTYASLPDTIADLSDAENYTFIRANICDEKIVHDLFSHYPIDSVMHFAAESHVDKSIVDPLAFVRTNVLGTAVLLNAARTAWKDHFEDKIFHHISTDEVYGSLSHAGVFSEQSPYAPRSPYAASKASADHLVQAYFHTYGLPALISNCSNNYGPYQFPEKFIPLMITHVLREEPFPIYGKGENVRDWLWVGDHVRALDLIFHHGRAGEKYNIGGGAEYANKDLAQKICALLDVHIGRERGYSFARFARFSPDRLGHDFRYAIDHTKITKLFSWTPQVTIDEGLQKTIDWYIQNVAWIAKCLEKSK